MQRAIRITRQSTRDTWDGAYQEFERGEASSGIGPGVVYELGHRQERGPVVLLEIAVDLEVLLQPLVGTLRLSVRLGVICGADVLCDVQLFAEFGGEVGRKVCILIRDDSIGYSEVWEDMLRIEGCHALASNGLFAWEEQ